MLYIGVDLGGTGIKAGVVSLRLGRFSPRLPCRQEGSAHTRRLLRISLCSASAPCRKPGVTMAQIKAIGVGVPGICDPRTGVIPLCTNLGWHDVPFVEELHKHTALPVYVDNDATVAGFAESIAGVSAGSASSVFLTLGTGVGGGIVIGGRPYSGVHGVGSEIGHMIIRMDGEPCTCGNYGCFGAVCIGYCHHQRGCARRAGLPAEHDSQALRRRSRRASMRKSSSTVPRLVMKPPAAFSRLMSRHWRTASSISSMCSILR